MGVQPRRFRKTTDFAHALPLAETSSQEPLTWRKSGNRLRGYVDARYAALGFGPRTEQRAHGVLMAELRARLSDERIAELAEAGSRLYDDVAAAEAFGVDAADDCVKLGAADTLLDERPTERTKPRCP